MKKSALYVKIINYALCLFIAVTLLVALPVVFFRISGAELTLGGARLFKIVSGSMEPVYSSGDYVISVERPEEELREGDIIAFVSDEEGILGEIVVHRIVARQEGGGFLTRGDANPVDDYSMVRPGATVGEVIMKLHLFKLADRLFSGNASFIALIVLPLLFIVANETLNLVAGHKRHKRITALILSYGLDPADPRLFEIAAKYGEEAVRAIAKASCAEQERETT